MLGRTLSHYSIVEQLGAGGMGVVYRARDQRLERDVALKVLPDGALADADARRRFRREALALSRLNHPGIAIIHDFDASEGIDFLVMEYVRGETLAQRLAAGALPAPEIATIGAQIGEALEAAHERGVVHRDLKPGNIVVTPRAQVKVLDFGLAHLLQADERAASPVHTSGTIAAGTLPYMAPEQLLGRPVDARTDLYALGAILYEMATGQPPFRAELPTAMVYEITSTPPPPPGRLRPDLPARLEEIILKCLEKDSGLRYQSALEIVVDLKRLSGPGVATVAQAAAGSGIRSLAVLPLENISRDPEQEYFADGMTDALISDLAQISVLRVISRTSVMRYKGTRKPLPEIARELGVDAVVEGAVMRAGDRVRITAQLIEAATDRHLWAKSYRRNLSDVLALQCEVAAAIAGEIRIQLTPTEKARLAEKRPVNALAYEAYLKGRYLWSRRADVEMRKAVQWFRQAIGADPDYALAHAGLADCYNILGDLRTMSAPEAAERARLAARRALELDEGLAEAHTSLGFVHFFFDWDWAAAQSAYSRALALNPGYATAHQWFAEFLISQGRTEEAVESARRALELDPLAPVMGTTLADTLYFSRRLEAAVEQVRATLETHPSFAPAYLDLGRALTQVGRHDDAIAAYLEAARLAGQDPDATPGLGHAYATAGRSADAQRVLARLLERHAADPVSISAHAVAVIYLASGDPERALEWLERGYDDRDRALVWLKVHPRLDALRGEARFRRLLERMKLAP